MVWNLWLHLFKEHQIHLHNLFMATTISGLRKEDKKKLKPKLCLLILKLCLGWKFLSVWDWKQIRLQFDCCYCPIKLTVNSSLSDVLSNSRREKFFSKKRVLYFPAFAFVILWRDVDLLLPFSGEMWTFAKMQNQQRRRAKLKDTASIQLQVFSHWK